LVQQGEVAYRSTDKFRNGTNIQTQKKELEKKGKKENKKNSALNKQILQKTQEQGEISLPFITDGCIPSSSLALCISKKRFQCPLIFNLRHSSCPKLLF